MERPLTERFRPDGAPLSIEEYEKAGGYQALRKVFTSMAPSDVVQEVIDADLRGRGGAGFSAGKKWSFVPTGKDAPHPKYVICNADEMEPGTFKDRYLIEHDAHQLIEGIIIAAYAIEADIAYVFLRGEYTYPAECLRQAIAAAESHGYLGTNILGSGFSLTMYLHLSGGRYMCGEETGLINALEGRRANPRTKPPHPTSSGMWGKPTAMNNVETLCNVPHIIAKGAEWFRGLSKSDEGGTKIYGVSGRVKRPGCWELPMATPMREILEEHAGGMRDGYAARAVVPGGASTNFVLEKDFDVPMDFGSMSSVGSRLGTGTMIVLDDRTCPVAMLQNMEEFFAQESCGWCTPCREGLPWTAKILRAIEVGDGRPEDLDVLAMNVRLIGPMGRTFCAFAPGAMMPLEGGLKYFREDFERHIRDGRCPWRA